MEDKILEVIRAAIPEKEMGIVKTVFQERETFKSELENYKQRVLELTKQLEVSNKELNEMRALKTENINRSVMLDKKELDIKERELKLDATLARNETNIIRECFDKVMKVPTIRKSIYKNISGNDYGSSKNITENNSETVSEE